MTTERSGSNPITTISFFRLEGAKARAWAFGQMQFARGPLNRTPGVSFCKMMGSGSGESFDPKPNFGVYAIMLVWPDADTARHGLASSPVLQRYRDQAFEHATVLLDTLHCRGLWDGAQPFGPGVENPVLPSPVGVITRATLKRRKLMQFWKSVPGVSKALAVDPSVLFKLGMGEVPWVQQVTFSMWANPSDMQAFAYREGPHRDAIMQVRQESWFKEDLFARFRILAWDGTWHGRSFADVVAAQSEPTIPIPMVPTLGQPATAG